MQARNKNPGGGRGVIKKEVDVKVGKFWPGEVLCLGDCFAHGLPPEEALYKNYITII